MTRKESRFALPGGMASVANRAQWMQIAGSGAWLLGPLRLALVAAGRSGNRPLLHRLERYWARWAASAARITVEIVGLDLIDSKERYVVAPLHEGLADVIALERLPLDLVYATRDEMYDWRFLGSYLRASRQPMVPTQSNRAAHRALLRGAEEALACRESVVVFPQGSILGIEVAFHPGAFRLAARTGHPLLPVVLTGSHKVWEHPYSPTLRFDQTIRLEILAPVEATEAVASRRDVEREMKRRALLADPAPRRFVPNRDGWWDGYPYEIDEDFPELRRRVGEHRRMPVPAEASSWT